MNWKKWYRECALCPRECGVDRLEGRRGFCGQRNPAFPEQEVQAPYFLPAVIWDVCFVRMDRSPEEGPEKKYQ